MELSPRALRRIGGILAVASLWTLAAPAAAESAADYFVHSLPGAPAEPPIKMHAGHIEVDEAQSGNLFFWHFQNQHIANKQRTVIWLNGGPGCSSEDGALMEIGPYRVKDEDTLEYNPGSWGEFANLLFVDNPVGTGFSYVSTNSYVHELTEMADQFVTFLEKYFAIFPEYEHDDIYFAGESFAGQHIPYIAKAIQARNKWPSAKVKWNIMGLIIGNGWIAPREQYDAYLKFAYQKGILDKDSDKAAHLQQQWRICEGIMASEMDHKKVDYVECEKVLQNLLDATSETKGGNRQCYNMYDVRLKDSYPACGMNWPGDLKVVKPYLRRKDVTKALHIKDGKQSGWTECNGLVGSAMTNRKSPPSIELLPGLLEEIPITLFSGAEDLICNHLGTEAFIANMEWNGGKGFEVSPGNWAPRRDWTFEGEAAGVWQEARNLTYVLFYNSSHMVPFDYPRRTRDMLDRVMGVDISSVGGVPADSRIDGEKGPQTSVGGHGPKKGGAEPAQADEETEKALQEAKWQAYRRSGEIVLAIVAIAAGVGGFYVWRDRRRRQRAQYQSLGMNPGGGGGGSSLGAVAGSSRSRAAGSGLESFGRNKRAGRDLEAGDFDESELDDLHVATPTENDPRYSIGGASDDDASAGGSSEKRIREKSNGSSSRS